MIKPHAVTINVYSQTKELLELKTLYNDLKDDDESAGVSSSEQHKLYPELPAHWNTQRTSLCNKSSVIKIAFIWFAYFNFRSVK